MAEVRYRICNICGVQIKNLYWSVKFSKMDDTNMVADFSRDCTSLDLCEVCKFKLDKQIKQINKTKRRKI